VKIGIRDDCRHCAKPIALCRVRGGKWLPMELAMVAYAPDVVDAYLPVRTARSVALVPLGEMSELRIRGVRWVAQQHRCAEWMRAAAAKRHERQAQREHVGSLSGSLQTVIDQWIEENTDPPGAA
jgi:hypothetical protein